MKKIQSHIFKLLLLGFMGIFAQCHEIQQPDEYYRTILAGEVSQTSVILQARIHKTDTLINNDIQGINGFVKFTVTRETESKSFLESPFFEVTGNSDFIARYEFTGLRPGQTYFYRISYGKDSLNVTYSSWNNFKTLLPVNSDKGVCFTVVSGMDYMSQGRYGELKSGFPAFRQIVSLHPDFMIGNGNNVYYDNPKDSSGIEPDAMRTHWHWLYSMPDFQNLLAHVPVYWMMNDHDFRYNDCDTTQIEIDGKPVSPDTRQAMKVFKEQVPLQFKETDPKLTYRTYRLNKDVQIWLLESRLYRSPNNSPDIPGKTLLGKTQLAWLKRTIKESNSAFKLIVCPTPIIGPDNENRTDNHVNIGGFRNERDSLLLWFKGNGYLNNGVYFICGDQPLMYHSVDPTGFEEFSCGSLVKTNLIPADTVYRDPKKPIVLPFIQSETGSGFLVVNSGRDEYNSPMLVFRFFDDQKKLLYAVRKF